MTLGAAGVNRRATFSAPKLGSHTLTCYCMADRSHTMTLSIRNPEADQLARRLAAMEQVTITEAVVLALKDAVKARTRKEGAIESAQRILREEGLAFVHDRKPVPDSVYHEYDHDLTGEED